MKGFRCLDSKRLGKQRVEAWQILNILRGVDNEGNPRKPGGWANHPAVKMWRGYETALAGYGILCCEAWIERGYNDSLLPRFEAVREGQLQQIEWPPWLLDDVVARSHRSNLIRKDPSHYQPLWPDETGDLDYVWPEGKKVRTKSLTRVIPPDMMEISIEGDHPLTKQKGHMMARKKVEVVEELDDIEEVGDLEAEAAEVASDDEAGSNMLTAKMAAKLLNTDGRTLRKFLRKKYGLVGQGARWAIDPSDIDDLRTEFETWKSNSTRGEGKTKEKAKEKAKAAPKPDPVVELDADELEEIEDIDEIEDLDFDD